MTVTTGYVPATYSGTGSLTQFDFSFKVFVTDDVTVYLKTGEGDPIEQTTGFTIALFDEGDSGGRVTFSTAPTSDQEVIIAREVDDTQEIPFPTSGDFQAEKHEDSFDKRTMISQEQKEALDRTVTLAIGTSGVSATLPTPSSNLLIGWNDDGDGLENKTVAEVGEPLPAVAETYIKRSLDNSVYEAKTPAEVALDVSPELDYADMSDTSITNQPVSPESVKNYVESQEALPYRYIAGMVIRNSEVDPDHDIVFGVGECRDRDNSIDIKKTIELIKQYNFVWAQGNNQGGSVTQQQMTGTFASSGTTVTGIGTLFTSEFKEGDIINKMGQDSFGRQIIEIVSDTEIIIALDWNITAGEDVYRGGAVVNGSVNCFELSNDDGTVLDNGFDTRMDAELLLAEPTVIAAGITKYRRVGSITTDSSANVRQFSSSERSGGAVRFIYSSPVYDFNKATKSYNAELKLTVPFGLKLECEVFYGRATSGSADVNSIIVSSFEGKVTDRDLGRGGAYRGGNGGSSNPMTNSSGKVWLYISAEDSITSKVTTSSYIDQRL
jgi:hypothetical protein